jgi:probable HAF family extracellular repeat protein
MLVTGHAIPQSRAAGARRAGLAAFATLVVGLIGAGQAAGAQPSPYPYTLIDLGTLGGPQAGQGNGPYLTASGVVAGTADTALTDPFGTAENGAFNGDPFVQHTFVWRHGGLTDLGALGDPTSDSSYPNGINNRGDEAGQSDTGAIDPLTGTAATVPVLWQQSQIIDLGTFGGAEGAATALNDHDQVIGVASNTTPDLFSMLGWGVQARAFLWQQGTLRDLGALGGPDSFAWFINKAGQVAGVSYISDQVDPNTGQPPVHAFLWQHGQMQDLGSLGGSIPIFGGVTSMNNRGEVAGQSDLAGDQQAHPFLWNGEQMIDLGTLGGSNGTASQINQAGAVAGIADLPDQTHHGFLWTGGVMHDLPPLSGSPCSNGFNLNNRDVVVGNSTNCNGGDVSATIWINGVPNDLNTLTAPSPLHLTEPVGINDAGEIIGYGVLPNGDEHNFLLIPAAY